MKGFYRLLNAEFALWFRPLGFLGMGMVPATLWLLYLAVKDSGPYMVHERYEDLYESSGGIIVFLLFTLALCANFVKSVYSQYWGSKSIYTYLTLPVKREAVYFSKLLVFVTCLLVLLAIQLVTIRLGYGLVAAKAAEYGEGSFVMHNGWFLAMIRSEFFRIVLPLSASRWLSSFSVLAAVATGIYYGVLCERSRRWGGFILLIVAHVTILSVLVYRLSEDINYMEPTGLYVRSVLLLGLSGFFMWHSIHMIKKGAIA